ncbi:LacI family DNA-binding transcriptional regulator [Cellulomonas composti]|uniref:LacI family transcriptional regulator n=1 Tax=Cellulomonas composti TaxID=266130 RepID=A0A511JC64_9CELL|nr:substrate-binding domain-containing protein [Cellulomonas composti]GEL95568.1 LacI family transcriptional regulator [Cellulomonas composti]
MTHADAVGLVLARPSRLLGIEPFFAELISGIEERLSGDDRSLLLHVVPDHTAEIAAYRRWSTGGVDAVVVVNVESHDSRLDALAGLGLPAVVVGGPTRDARFANVWIDNGGAMRDAVRALVDLGHTRLARVSGPASLAHTRTRTEAFLEQCAERGARGTVVEGDYQEESGARATRELLTSADRPTAIVYDNDVMAVAGLQTATDLGFAVPQDVSLLAWDDSALCRLSRPPLSAMSLDVHAMGEQVADGVLALLAGERVSVTAPAPRLVTRGSTGPAPA